MSKQNAARDLSAAPAPAESAEAELAALIAELRAYLTEVSEGKLSVEAIDPASHLFDFGYVDSLSAVLLTAHLDQQYGVRLEDMDLLERFTTLEQLAAHVQANRR